jgi:hypothetical protein
LEGKLGELPSICANFGLHPVTFATCGTSSVDPKLYNKERSPKMSEPKRV